jgi:hypothetical protein
MTRHGSLIYYLSAWTLGCFFMSVAIWVNDMIGHAENAFSARSAFGLLFFYFYGLIFGALATFVGAWLLRRIMTALRCKTPTHWAVVGMILAPLLIVMLGVWGRHVGMGQRPGMRLQGLLTFGPKTVLEAGWWLAIPAGAASGYFLCRIQRAFAPPQESSASVSSASGSV